MEFYKLINKKVKYFIWLSIPGVVRLYFKMKWSFSKKITIIPHGGLGDMAVIVPALRRLAKHFDSVNIVFNEEYFEAIRILFELPKNIHCLNFTNQNRNNYTLDKEFIASLKGTGTIIKLGMYATTDPIINYPDSFFLKLGINPKYAIEKYKIEFSQFMNVSLNQFFQTFNNEYIYVNLETSEKLMEFNEKYTGNRLCVSYDRSALALGIKDYYNTNNLAPATIHQSIINNVLICLQSSNAIISDAGLFNIVIRFENCPDLTVATRKHHHSHNNLLYKIKFNGTIQSCSIN